MPDCIQRSLLSPDSLSLTDWQRWRNRRLDRRATLRPSSSKRVLGLSWSKAQVFLPCQAFFFRFDSHTNLTKQEKRSAHWSPVFFQEECVCVFGGWGEGALGCPWLPSVEALLNLVMRVLSLSSSTMCPVVCFRLFNPLGWIRSWYDAGIYLSSIKIKDSLKRGTPKCIFLNPCIMLMKLIAKEREENLVQRAKSQPVGQLFFFFVFRLRWLFEAEQWRYLWAGEGVELHAALKSRLFQLRSLPR